MTKSNEESLEIINKLNKEIYIFKEIDNLPKEILIKIICKQIEILDKYQVACGNDYCNFDDDRDIFDVQYDQLCLLSDILSQVLEDEETLRKTEDKNNLKKKE